MWQQGDTTCQDKIHAYALLCYRYRTQVKSSSHISCWVVPRYPGVQQIGVCSGWPTQQNQIFVCHAGLIDDALCSVRQADEYGLDFSLCVRAFSLQLAGRDCYAIVVALVSIRPTCASLVFAWAMHTSMWIPINTAAAGGQAALDACERGHWPELLQDTGHLDNHPMFAHEQDRARHPASTRASYNNAAQPVIV